MADRQLGVRPARLRERRDEGKIRPRWGYNRARSTYTRSMSAEAAAVRRLSVQSTRGRSSNSSATSSPPKEFVNLLLYTRRAGEKITGDRGADFRSEAWYIAGSLTNLDFRGPRTGSRTSCGPTTSSTQTQRTRRRRSSHIAIDRVKDSTLIRKTSRGRSRSTARWPTSTAR